MDDLDLVGMDYLWRVIMLGSDVVADKAIALMKELHANLGPRLQPQQVDSSLDACHQLRWVWCVMILVCVSFPGTNSQHVHTRLLQTAANDIRNS